MTSLSAAADYRRADRLFNAPPVSKHSLVNGLVRESCAFCRLNDLGPHCFSVPGLLGSGGPFAVLGRVALAAVHSLKAHARFAMAHIFQKRREIAPSLANGYTDSTVSTKRDVVRVLAALTHCVPHGVYLGARKAMGLVGWWLAFKASATGRVAVLQVPGAHDGFRAAITDASPSNDRVTAFGPFGSGALKRREHPKSFAGEVMCYSHDALYVGIKYDIA